MSEFRRFFFDDGSSRKRWHVQLEGRLQTVEYGRLGGSLRKSQKSFKTTAEAINNTENLIVSKKRSGYVEINPSRLEIVRPKGRRPATEEQIQALETRLGRTLPDEYRSFLRTQNGGRPNPAYIKLPGVPGFDNVGVDSLFHLQPSQPTADELSRVLGTTAVILPEGHLPFAVGHDFFTLSLKAKSFGCVYWWDHETDTSEHEEKFVESDGYLLAGSFDEFLTRIAVFFGDEDEAGDEAPSSSKGAAKEKPKASIRRLLGLVKHEHTPEKIKEIEQVVQELADLSAIKDGEWPFVNIQSDRLLRCLLEAGLNPEVTDTNNHTLLWQCASSVPCVNLLLKHGVDIERRSGQYRETALMRAIFVRSIPAVQRLLEAGANPTVRLPWHIGDNLKYNKTLGKMMNRARVQWKRQKAKKKAAKK